jgi:competence protein ComEC
MLVALPLFTNKKEWVLFFVAMFTIFCVNLYFEYSDYLEFKSSHRVEVKVLSHYPKINKKGKEYYVLKCKNDKVKFYTTTYKKYENLRNRYISIVIKNENISFYQYLSGFYTPSYSLKILDHIDVYSYTYDSLSSYHEDDRVKEFYGAIFLGSSISKDTRESISILGISHLVAISGFHISILVLFLYFTIKYPYRFFQQRYFPYRNMRVDIIFISLVILYWYLSFVDFVPSLLRSYIMLLIGSFFLIRYIKILSFATLLIAVVVAISLFPKMLFSIGFWFSVSGVFYIYLFLYYLKGINKFLVALLFNLWIFMAMIPIAHYYFGIFSIYQLFSPILSLLFVVFYPIAILIHTIFTDYVTIFDKLLEYLLHIEDNYIQIKTSIWFLIYYITISILSIFYKRAFILLNFTMIMFLSYLLLKYTKFEFAIKSILGTI